MKQQAVSQTKWIEHLIWAFLVKTCSVTKMLSNCICNGFFFSFSNFPFSLDGFFLSSAFAFGARRERRGFRWINLDWTEVINFQGFNGHSRGCLGLSGASWGFLGLPGALHPSTPFNIQQRRRTRLPNHLRLNLLFRTSNFFGGKGGIYRIFLLFYSLCHNLKKRNRWQTLVLYNAVHWLGEK